MNNYEYYIQQAIKEARKLNGALEKENTIFSLAKKIFNEGVSDWDVKTPVTDPITNLRKHNLITMASKISFGDINKVKLTPFGQVSDISGYCKRFDDSAQIVVTYDNYCWRRYFVSKEILHLFLYDGKNITDTQTLLKELIANLLECDPSISDEDVQSNADRAAYYGAIELLVPSVYVPDLLEAKQSMVDKGFFVGEENLQIARLFGVPEKLVEFRLNGKHHHLFEVD